MKGISFRIILILLTFLLSGITEGMAQTYERTFTFTFAKEDFTVPETKDGYRIIPNTSFNWYRDEDGNKPALPFIGYWILLPDGYRIKDYTFSHDDIWFDENIILAPNPLPVPISDNEGFNKENESPYPLVEYPAKIATFDESIQNGYRILDLSFNPFTYYADTRKLALATTVDLKITIEPVKEEEQRRKDPDNIKHFVYNPEDIDKGTENWNITDLELGEENITIHVDGRPLAELITTEQQESLQTLNITGKLTEEDYAFIRNNSWPKLKALNLREADIDTIPVKAFYNYDKDNYDKECQITLPEELVYIGDSAFFEANVSLVLSGKFPKRGVNTTKGFVMITPTEDNEHCQLYSGEYHEKNILSSDGKILYYSNNHAKTEIIPEGVEIIAERAFEGRTYSDVTFPKTLKRIEDYAFYNSSITIMTSSDKSEFTFLSAEPPTLGKDVFSYIKGGGGTYGKGLPTLYIPDTWKGEYTQKDEQWKIFKDVEYWTPLIEDDILQNEITIHVDGRPLAELITTGQQEVLQTLNVTGKLTDEDYAFIRNNSLPKLKALNLREADIDTIPVKAFYNYDKDNYDKECQITLPEKLVYIGDSAFYKCISSLILTGIFPRRGVDAFNPYRNRIWLAADNESCVEYNDDNYSIYILSADKKILYHANETTSRNIIPEGVEIIAKRAFENSFYDDLYFPHTLKKIEDYAFRNSCMALYDWNFIFLSTEVPTLGKEVFSFLPYSGTPSLTIPQEWKNIYTAQDEQWNVFKKVTFAYNPPPTESMSSLEFKHCTVSMIGNTLFCTAPNAVKLEIYTMDAVKVGEARFNNGTATVTVNQVPATYLYIVTYPDGRRESGKVRSGTSN